MSSQSSAELDSWGAAAGAYRRLAGSDSGGDPYAAPAEGERRPPGHTQTWFSHAPRVPGCAVICLRPLARTCGGERACTVRSTACMPDRHAAQDATQCSASSVRHTLPLSACAAVVVAGPVCACRAVHDSLCHCFARMLQKQPSFTLVLRKYITGVVHTQHTNLLWPQKIGLRAVLMAHLTACMQWCRALGVPVIGAGRCGVKTWG